jgi:hypothetical protein
MLCPFRRKAIQKRASCGPKSARTARFVWFDGPIQAYHALTGAAAKRRTALQLHPLRFTQQRGPTALFRNIGSGPSLTARAHLWFASIYGKVPRAPWAPQKRWRLGVY